MFAFNRNMHMICLDSMQLKKKRIAASDHLMTLTNPAVKKNLKEKPCASPIELNFTYS